VLDVPYSTFEVLEFGDVAVFIAGGLFIVSIVHGLDFFEVGFVEKHLELVDSTTATSKDRKQVRKMRGGRCGAGIEWEGVLDRLSFLRGCWLCGGLGWSV
jgi:hypothetical protein